MKLGLIFAATVVTSASAWSEVTLNVSSAGRPLGTATFQKTLLKSGEVTTQLKIRLSNGMVIQQDLLVNAKGELLKTIETETIGSVQNGKSATFAPNGDATVVVTQAGKTTTKVVPYHHRGSRKDVSEFWVIKTHPSPQTWVQHDTLRLDKLTWVHEKTTYAGKKLVKVGGKSVMGHTCLEDSGGVPITLVFDDAGQLLKLEENHLVLERQW